MAEEEADITAAAEAEEAVPAVDETAMSTPSPDASAEGVEAVAVPVAASEVEAPAAPAEEEAPTAASEEEEEAAPDTTDTTDFAAISIADVADSTRRARRGAARGPALVRLLGAALLVASAAADWRLVFAVWDTGHYADVYCCADAQCGTARGLVGVSPVVGGRNCSLSCAALPCAHVAAFAEGDAVGATLSCPRGAGAVATAAAAAPGLACDAFAPEFLKRIGCSSGCTHGPVWYPRHPWWTALLLAAVGFPTAACGYVMAYNLKKIASEGCFALLGIASAAMFCVGALWVGPSVVAPKIDPVGDSHQPVLLYAACVAGAVSALARGYIFCSTLL